MGTTRRGHASPQGGGDASPGGLVLRPAGPGPSGNTLHRTPPRAPSHPDTHRGTPRGPLSSGPHGLPGPRNPLWEGPLLPGVQRGRGSLPGLRTQLGRRPRCSQGRGTGKGTTGPRAQAPWWRPPLVPPTSWPPPGSRAVASCTGSAGAADCPARPGTCLRAFHGPKPRQTPLPSGPQRAGIRPSTVPSPDSFPQGSLKPLLPRHVQGRVPGMAKRVPLDGSVAPEMPSCPSPRSTPSALCRGKNANPRAKRKPGLSPPRPIWGHPWPTSRTRSLADGPRPGPPVARLPDQPESGRLGRPWRCTRPNRIPEDALSRGGWWNPQGRGGDWAQSGSQARALPCGRHLSRGIVTARCQASLTKRSKATGVPLAPGGLDPNFR